MRVRLLAKDRVCRDIAPPRTLTPTLSRKRERGQSWGVVKQTVRCQPGSPNAAAARPAYSPSGCGAGFAMSALARLPEPMIASARNSTGAFAENSAVVPTAVHAG